MEPRILLSVVSWASDTSGDWGDARNWMDDQGVSRVPGPGDDVVIDRSSASPTVTFDSVSASIKSLTSRDPVILASGTLSVDSTVEVDGTFTLSRATLSGATIVAGTTLTGTSLGGTLDGVTLDGDLNLAGQDGAVVTFIQGLTLDGTIRLGAADGSTRGAITFSGTQALDGTGDVLFGASPFNALNNTHEAGSLLTIGAGVNLHGSSGTIGGSDSNLVDHGTIAADVSGGRLTVDGSDWTSSGALTAAPGATLDLNGHLALGSGARFGGGGTLDLLGSLDNGIAPFVVDGTRTVLNLQRGTISGGTVALTGGARMMGTSLGGTLDGVTLDGDLDLAGQDGAQVTVTGGLTLDGTIAIGAADGSTRGLLNFTGTQTLDGIGVVILGASPTNTLNVGGDPGSVLTIGQDLTVRGSSGTVGNPSFGLVDRGTIAVDVAGGFLNVAGSTLTSSGTLRAGAGTLYLYGSDVVDTGTIAVAGGSSFQIDAGLTIDDPGLLAIDPAGELDVAGDLTGGTRDADAFAAQGLIQFDRTSGPGAPRHLEVMSQDLGTSASGFDQNFALGTLNLGSNAVQLVDQSRNTAGNGTEALYVNTLIVPAGSSLDLNGLPVYVRFAQIDGTISGGTLNSIADGGSLTLGTPAPGDIQSGSEVDDWTFLGRADQSIAAIVNTGAAGGLHPLPPGLDFAQVQVIDPSGNVLATASDDAAGTDAAAIGVTLPVDGVYHVRVQTAPDHPSGTGHYILTVDDSTVHSMTAVVNQTIHGQTASAYSQDRWTFSATAGESVRFDLIAVASPSFRFTLTGPDGSALFAGLSSSSDLLTLPLSGTYTLSASGGAGAYTYRLDQTTETPLALGTSDPGTLTGDGQSEIFTVRVPTIEPLIVSFEDDSPSDVVEVYVQYGSPPTRSEYDERSTDPTATDQRVVVPSAAPGNWYILVYASSIPTLGGFTIAAAAGDTLSGVTPDHSGDSADAVLTLTGTGFDSGTAVSLVASGGTTYPIANIVLDNSTRMQATIPAHSIPPGRYDVKVSQSDGTSGVLPGAFTMDQGGQAVLKSNIVVPGALGNNAPATLYVQYSNTGDIAMPAPLLLLTASRPAPSGTGRVQGAELTLDPSLVTSGSWAAGEPVGYGPSVEILASGATPGVLEPGESIEVPVYYAGWELDEWNLTDRTMDFDLSVLRTDDTTTIDWDSIEAASQPPEIAATAWQGLFANYRAEGGSTWGAYVSRLDAEAQYLGTLGENITDVGRLNDFEMLQADGLSPMTELGASVDASLPIPGPLSLSFDRAFEPTIIGRNTMGPLGLGWSDSWQSSLAVQADGDVVVTEPGGLHRTFEPDSRYASHYFDQAGDYGVLTPAGAGTFTLTEQDGTVTAYNADGTLNYVEDTDGNRITAGYTEGRLTSLTASSGQSLTISYNAAGLIATVTDSEGRVTSYTYDASGTHLATVTDFTGQQTSYTYDIGTNAAKENALLSIAYPDGTHSNYTYDTEGRFASTSADGGAEMITFSYGPAGSVMLTDADGGETTIEFDELGRVAKTIDPLGRTTRFVYDSNSNLTRIIDPAGQVTQNRYDASGNLISTTDPLGQTTRFSYTSQFNELASMVDANGNTTQYGYDGRGNLMSTTDADGTIANLAYDPVGNVISSTDQMGRPIGYTYNASGQILTKTYADGSVATFTYDERGNLRTATDSTGETDLDFDAADRLTQITYPTGLYLKYTYDASGRRTGMVDQDGFTVDYRYDSVGRLSELTDADGNPIVKYIYDPAGRLVRQDNGNGTYTTYTYNKSGQVLTLVNSAPDGSINSSFTYTYNDLGLQSTETTLDGTWTYTYDAAGELTRAVFHSTNPTVPDQDEAIYYDAMGNRTSTVINGVTTIYTTNNLNQYTQVGGTRYSYDLDGNLIEAADASGTTTYSYNQDGDLTRLTAPGGVAQSYQYDAFGYRVAMTAGGQESRYLIDPSGLGYIAGAYDSGGQRQASYVYGLGLTSRFDANGQGSYYDFDARGNTADVTGPSGASLGGYAYDPFGNILSQSTTAAGPFGFLGQYGITTSIDDLYDDRDREYSSSLGRFQSRDPIGILAGGNLYTYSMNNYISIIDASGDSGATTNSNPLLEFEANIIIFVKRIVEGVFGIIGVKKIPTPGHGEHSEEMKSKGDSRKGTKNNGDTNNGNQQPGQQPQGSEQQGSEPEDPGQQGPGPGWLAVLAALAAYLARFLPVLAADAGSPGGDRAPTIDDEAGHPVLLASAPYIDLAAEPSDSDGIEALNPRDPNALQGPAGFGTAAYVAPSIILPYRINFENESTATAPAQRVTVTDQLDPHLDWSTFQLTEVGFGDTLLSIPAGSQYYATTVPMNENGKTFDVEIEVGLDVATGLVTATFQSIDPDTQLPPDVLTGFLPPEDGTGRGMGHLSYIIQPKSNLPTGIQIRNVAVITFDANPAIATDQVDPHDPTKGTDPAKMALNTIDAGPPTSSVSPLPAVTNSATFPVSWSGSDDSGGSGIGTYGIYVSDDGGPFVAWLQGTTLTTESYAGVSGHSYAFYSVATDNVGNVQPTPTAAQASTTVQGRQATSLSAVSGSGTYGGTATVTATLTAGNTGVASETVSFTFNDGVSEKLLGSAKTDADGVAVLTGISLAGLGAGAYPGDLVATFAGDSSNLGTSGTGDLAVGLAALTVTANAASKIYGDGDPAFSVSYAGFAAGEGPRNLGGQLQFATTEPTTGHAPVGRYTITPSGLTSANYRITYVSGTLTVTPRQLTVKANDESRTYGAADPAFAFTLSGFVPGEDAATAGITGSPVLGTTATPASDVGTYTITVAAGTLTSANYDFPAADLVNGALSIAAAPLTITADDATRASGQPDPPFTATYSGFVLGQDSSVLGGTISFGTTATAASPAGTYPIVPGGLTSSNYSIAYRTGTLSVTPAPITPPVTVTGLRWQMIKLSRKKSIEQLIVTFSGAMNSGDADNRAAYVLDSAVRKKKVTRYTKPVPLTSAAYNPGTHSVTLALRGKPPKQALQLTIESALIHDAENRPLDGNHDGQPGGDFVATLNGGGVISMARRMMDARAGQVSYAAIDALMAGRSAPGR